MLCLESVLGQKCDQGVGFVVRFKGEESVALVYRDQKRSGKIRKLNDLFLN